MVGRLAASSAVEEAPEALPGVHTLVENGVNRAYICLSDKPTRDEAEAAQILRSYIKRATGAEVPIIHQSERANAAGEVCIFIGDQEASRAIGLSSRQMDQEEYIIRSNGENLHLIGRDTHYGDAPDSDAVLRSAATKWAVNYLADRYLGVRWLWPGELGTYVPSKKSVAVPSLDIKLRPALALRRLRIALYRPKDDDDTWMLGKEEQQRIKTAALGWLENHQMGSRAKFRFKHSFTQWWDRYSEKSPELFAEPPSGRYQQPFPSAKAVKLRLANPAVLDTIEAEYRAAGAPDYWNVAPNDGIGFDTSEQTRRWDGPDAADPELIWLGKAPLSRRYITFWNKVHARLSEINPQVRLSTLIYGAYRVPPSGDIEVTARLTAAFVQSYTAKEEWKYWSERGCEMILRPNWWCVGGSAPHLPIKQEGGFIEFARDHGMVGIDIDSLIGHWGLQAPRYYVVARLLARPDLSTEEAVAEFASAFGAGSEAIRKYLAYWQDYSEKAAYPVSAGGASSIDPDGLFETAARRLGFQHMPILNSSVMIPALYPDARLAPAFALLHEAEEKIKPSGDSQALERVAFLRDGLTETVKVREVVELATALRKGENEKKRAQYDKRRLELRELRHSLSLRGIVWGDSLYANEKRRKVPTFPEFINHKAYDVREEGM